MCERAEFSGPLGGGAGIGSMASRSSLSSLLSSLLLAEDDKKRECITNKLG